MNLPSNIDDLAYQFFVEEARELLERMERILLNFFQDHSVPKIRELLRAAHTLKGGAAQVNLTEIQTIAGNLEKNFRSLEQKNVDIDSSLVELLAEAYESLRLPLQTQIQTGQYDGAEALAKAEPIFAQLEAKLETIPSANTQLAIAPEVGEDMKNLIAIAEVTEAIERLEMLLANSSTEELSQKLPSQMEMFRDLGELLQISEFVAIAQTTLTTLSASPQIAREIGNLAAAAFRAAHKVFLQENFSTDIPAELLCESEFSLEQEEASYSLENVWEDSGPPSESSILTQTTPRSVKPLDWVPESESNVVQLHESSAANVRENPTDMEPGNLPAQKELEFNTAKLLVWQTGLTILTLPYDKIEENLSPKFAEIINSKQQKFLHWRSQFLPIYKLSELLSYRYPQPASAQTQVLTTTSPQENREVSLLIIREGKLLFALESPMKRIITDPELTIKPFGSAIASPSYIYGCTMLADELPVPVIDVAALLSQTLDLGEAEALRDRAQIPVAATQLFDQATVNQKPPPTPTDKAQTILVVDDSSTWRGILSFALENAGYQVVQAEDGQEGINQLKQNSQIQLIISDLEMPNINGFEFLSYCCQNQLLTKVPVVILSTSTSEQHRQLARKLGAVAYFTKPYNESELLGALHSIFLI
ncbi:MAG: response regulator [Prochloraceae cyanobacterium]